MTIIVYGIRNCDTLKRAREWLAARRVEHVFHDYKVAGIDAATLGRWVDEVGWERLLNISGTTFRKLPDAERAALDRPRATALTLAHPSLVRRPVIEGAGPLLVGFDPDAYAKRFPQR